MKDYAYFDSKDVLKELKTSLNGLTTKETNNRIKKYGLNELPKEKQKGVVKIFFDTFKDPIIYVLLVAAILSFIARETLDACAILFIILVDSIVFPL